MYTSELLELARSEENKQQQMSIDCSISQTMTKNTNRLEEESKRNDFLIEKNVDSVREAQINTDFDKDDDDIVNQNSSHDGRSVLARGPSTN